MRTVLELFTFAHFAAECQSEEVRCRGCVQHHVTAVRSSFGAKKVMCTSEITTSITCVTQVVSHFGAKTRSVRASSPFADYVLAAVGTFMFLAPKCDVAASEYVIWLINIECVCLVRIVGLLQNKLLAPKSWRNEISTVCTQSVSVYVSFRHQRQFWRQKIVAHRVPMKAGHKASALRAPNVVLAPKSIWKCPKSA